MKWQRLNPPPEAACLFRACPELRLVNSVGELVDLVCGGPGSDYFEVVYEVAGQGRVVEATVARVRNGVSVNYPEPFMRRRDPDCMVIADNSPIDKLTFQDRFGTSFASLREETFAWLQAQPLIAFGLLAGQEGMGTECMVIVPANAGFFALGMALLQRLIPYDELPETFQPQAVVFVAPPFRHSHFGGKQVVVHNRRPELHELFPYNLYSGPSAKKGIYGVLLVLQPHFTKESRLSIITG